MALGRVDAIIARVQRKLIQAGIATAGVEDYKKNGIKSPNPDDILDDLNSIELEICQSGALKGYRDVLLESGNTRYDLFGNIYKLKEIIRDPIEWITDDPIFIVASTEEWKRIIEEQRTSQQPTWFFVWDNVLHVHPAPSKTGMKLQTYLYYYPEIEMSQGGDPSVGKEWDRCLMLGAISRIVGGDTVLEYANELATQIHNHMNEAAKGVMVKQSFTEDIGY